MSGDVGPRLDDRLTWELTDTRLAVRHWPDEPECVVFSSLSGEVHLLNLGALALLEALVERSQTTHELAERLACDAGRPADAEWSAAVRAALTTLDSAGLIAPREP